MRLLAVDNKKQTDFFSEEAGGFFPENQEEVFPQDTAEHDPTDNEILAVALDEEEAESSIEDPPIGSTMQMMAKEIFSYPLLTPEQEQECGRMLKGSPEARRQAMETLVLHNQRYVLKMSRRFTAPGMDAEDLFQEGILGLMKAAEYYDIDRGFRFSTYATWWIRQSIGRAVSDKGTLIRYPVHMKEKHYRMNQAIREAEKAGKTLTDEDLAEILKTSKDNVRQLRHMSLGVASLNVAVGEDDSATELGDLVADSSAETPEDVVLKSANQMLVEELLSILGDREKKMMKLRFGLEDGTPHTLEEVGNLYGLSRERVRQIEVRSIRKMKNNAMRKNIRFAEII